MSRWTEAYENFKNSGNWEKILNHAGENFDVIEDGVMKMEALRFSKVVKILSILINAIDPEIIPSTIWNTIDANAQSCASLLPPPDQINSQADNYQTINDNLDTILKRISPFVASDKKGAEAAVVIFREYEATARDAIESLNKESKRLGELIKKEEASHASLKKGIEGFLPEATSAGLASAYGKHKEEAAKSALMYTKLFTLAIVLLSVAGIVVDVFLANVVYAGDVSFWNERFVLTVSIALPVVWWAAFCSKRRSENNRLYEEYAHKEALAKSYNSYRQQIEALPGQNEELLKKLLDVAIEAVAYNPSQTLDKKHGDKTPVHEAIEKLREELKDLIPKKK